VPYFSHILTKLQSAPGPHHHHRRAPPPISDGAAPRTKRTSLDLSPKSTHLFAWNFLFFRPILGLVGLGCLRPSSSLLSSTYYEKIKKHIIIVFNIAYFQGPRSSSTFPVPRVPPQLSFLQPPPCRSLIHSLFVLLPLVPAVSPRFGSYPNNYPPCSIHSKLHTL
jgi:hypothetical protein